MVCECCKSHDRLDGYIRKMKKEKGVITPLRPYYMAEKSAKKEVQKHMKRPILRGELYYADLDPVIGSEQGGERPVVILQNNRGNHYSPTVIVAPLTTQKIKPQLPTHVAVAGNGLRSSSLVLLEQIRTIDKQRMRNYIGIVTDTEMKAIEKAVLASVEIDFKQ